MPDPWIWDDVVKRYRTPTGQFISAKNLIPLRDEFIANRMAAVNNLADQLASGQINIQQWVLNMRQEIKITYMAEYELGVGGRNMMGFVDFGSVGGQLKNQYEYLNNFANDIVQGNLSQKQIEARSRMYIDGGTQSFERARSRSMGLPQLPAYPGDGSTICRSNCKCHWRIVESELGWDCYWTLGPAEHCEDCARREQTWNPLYLMR